MPPRKSNTVVQGSLPPGCVVVSERTLSLVELFGQFCGRFFQCVGAAFDSGDCVVHATVALVAGLLGHRCAMAQAPRLAADRFGARDLFSAARSPWRPWPAALALSPARSAHRRMVRARFAGFAR